MSNYNPNNNFTRHLINRDTDADVTRGLYLFLRDICGKDPDTYYDDDNWFYNYNRHKKDVKEKI